MSTALAGVSEPDAGPLAGDVSAAGARQPPCLIVLRALYPTLTEAERKVAARVLADPDLVLYSSITEVARASGVGLSTVSRFSAKLGYAGFPEMKIALAVERLNPDRGTPEPVAAGDDPATVSRKVLGQAAQNLLDTAALLDPLELERAARAITEARRVELYAVGTASGAIARSAETRIRLLQIPCVAVVDQYEHEPCAALLGSADVAIGVSYSGDTEAVVRAIAVAGDAGARTVCLTKDPRSPLAGAAEIRLLVASQQAGRWGYEAASRVAMLGVVEALYAVVALLRHREPAAERPPALANPNGTEPNRNDPEERSA